jgi:hypothetical protein
MSDRNDYSTEEDDLRVSIRLGVLVSALLILAFGLLSQERKTGAVAGTVVVAKNSPLSGAKVAIKGPSLKDPLKTETDKNGQFRFEDVPAGKDYMIGAQLEGYESAMAQGIVVTENKTTTVHLEMPATRISGLVTGNDDSRQFQYSINVGSRDGVTRGMFFAVYRQRELVASIEAIEVRERETTCNLRGTSQIERPKVGDIVIYEKR